MDFTQARTAEERLLLTLIEKVEDNTAAVNKLLLKNNDREWMGHEGNVLEGWQPPLASNAEQEAKWIRGYIEDTWRFNGNHLGMEMEDHIYITHMENMEHLRAGGFEVDFRGMNGSIDHIRQTNYCGRRPLACKVKWTAK